MEEKLNVLKKRRNPFTGSGHSFVIGFTYDRKHILVVIPLPVQVILSL